MRGGEVDVAFGLDYPDAPIPRDRSVQLVHLQPEGFAVATAAGSTPPAGYVEVARLAELDWIVPSESSQYGRAIRSGFRRLGFEPRVVHEVTDTAASLQRLRRHLRRPDAGSGEPVMRTATYTVRRTDAFTKTDAVVGPNVDRAARNG